MYIKNLKIKKDLNSYFDSNNTNEILINVVDQQQRQYKLYNLYFKCLLYVLNNNTSKRNIKIIKNMQKMLGIK
jgi:recombinational DNA repair protein (RecF pathway)